MEKYDLINMIEKIHDEELIRRVREFLCDILIEQDARK